MDALLIGYGLFHQYLVQLHRFSIKKCQFIIWNLLLSTKKLHGKPISRKNQITNKPMKNFDFKKFILNMFYISICILLFYYLQFYSYCFLNFVLWFEFGLCFIKDIQFNCFLYWFVSSHMNLSCIYLNLAAEFLKIIFI